MIASILRVRSSSPNRMMEPSPKLLVMEAIAASRSAVRLSSPPDAVWLPLLPLIYRFLRHAFTTGFLHKSQSFPPALRSVNLGQAVWGSLILMWP